MKKSVTCLACAGFLGCLFCHLVCVCFSLISPLYEEMDTGLLSEFILLDARFYRHKLEDIPSRNPSFVHAY
jgi:hypothetical protein